MNNLGLALEMTLKFYTSVVKGLKQNVEKFVGLILNRIKVACVVKLKLAFTEWFFYNLVKIFKPYKIRYLNFPVDTRRRFNVYKMPIRCRRRRIDVL